ncbi:MAG TPA: hypothetical protein VNN79_17245 [Actinomycetota bacterium]|nr:hypothetical protein [Actinomycetota bacterium]
MSANGRAVRRRRRPTVLTSVAALVCSLVVAVAPAILPRAPFTVRAQGAGCLDDAGNPVVCPISLDPISLPTGQVMGEYELASAFRKPTTGIPSVQPYEWKTGAAIGACVPLDTACTLTNMIRVGSTPAPDVGHEVPAAALDAPSAAGDTAVVGGDFNGDGRDEQVTAARCAGSGEICLDLYDPATNTHSGFQRTGTYDDTVGTGRIAMAQGLMLRTSSVIHRVTFALNPDGGVLATFFAELPTGFVRGQPVRFEDDPDLAAAMCPALAAGSVLCNGTLSASWLPVLSVSPTTSTFTLRVGNVIQQPNADNGQTGGPILPPNWPDQPDLGSLDAPVAPTDLQIQVTETGEDQPTVPFGVFVDDEQMAVTRRTAVTPGGDTFVYRVTRPHPVFHDAGAPVARVCTTCNLGVTGIRPGLAVAWDAPVHEVDLATYSVTPGRPRPFTLLDQTAVGTLATTAMSASADGGTPVSITGRDALDMVTGDFDGDGQSEMAVGWGSSGGLGLVRFFADNEAKQLVPLSPARPWDALNAQWPYFVSMSTGNYAPLQGANTAGDDLAVAWGGVGHDFETFDVSTSFRLRNVTLDDTSRANIADAWDGSKDRTYKPGAIIHDPLGWWTTPGGGTSSCSTTTTTDAASKLYFPAPGFIPTFRPNVPASSAWDVTSPFDFWNPAANQVLRGVLDPVKSRLSARVKSTSHVLSGLDDNVLQGQYVSPPLAAQQLTGRSMSMFMETAMAAPTLIVNGTLQAELAIFPGLSIAQVVVKVVSNDGTQVRGVLYAGYPGDLANDGAHVYQVFQTAPDEYGAGRAFPPSDGLPTAVLNDVDVQAGDRLVVEFGSKILTVLPTASRIFAGTAGSKDVPGEGASGLDPDTGHPGYSPWIKFSKDLQFDDCKTHFSDEGIHDWVRATVPAFVRTWSPPNDPTSIADAAQSYVRIGGGDFNMDGLDEVAIGETRPDSTHATAAPIDVSVWRTDTPNCETQPSPAAGQGCATADGPATGMLLTKAGSTVISNSMPTSAAVPSTGVEGSGQLSMAIGRVGRPAVTSPDFPNDMNPNIVVSWTCDTTKASSCGRTSAGASGVGVATEPLAVCVPVHPDGGVPPSDQVCSPGQPLSGLWTVTGKTSSFTKTADPIPAQWSSTAFTLLDLNGDTTILGSPNEYLDTGRVQPLMIMRSPPVHFDAIDSNGDGGIDPSETWDVNTCFGDYLQTGDSYTCLTQSTFGSTTTVTSTLRGDIHDSGTFSGGFQINASGGGGFGADGCERQDDGSIAIGEEPGLGVGGPLDPLAIAVCAEASGFLKMGWSSGQNVDRSKTIGQTFSYTSEVTTNAGTDAVYAAVQQNEVLEYPVYAGAGWGLGSGDPIDYVTVVSPLKTQFQWTSSEDLGFPVTGHGAVPQNVLSYARTEDQLKTDVPFTKIAKVCGAFKSTTTRSPSNECSGPTPALDGSIQVSTSGGTGLGVGCAQSNEDNLADQTLNTGLKSGSEGDVDTTGRFLVMQDVDKARANFHNPFDQFPCAVANQPVEIQKTHTLYDRSYLITQQLASGVYQLEPVVPVPQNAALPTDSSGGEVQFTPGSFPVDAWTVRRSHALSAEVTTDTQSGFERSFGWQIGNTLDAHVEVDFAIVASTFGATGFLGLGAEGDFSGAYEHNELQTIDIGTTRSTTFHVDVTGDIKPNIAYTIRPFLTQASDGALLLDWTASENVLDTFWHTYYFDGGPDPAFALPDEMTPYKSPYPNSRPGATVPTLLRSPDLSSWRCATIAKPKNTILTTGQDCTPGGAADPDKLLLLSAKVHNFSLAGYGSSQPVKVRFYVGDPSRGGYQIAESDLPSVRDKSCISRFCLPPQAQQGLVVPWNWSKLYPGLSGQGRPTSPLAIYAVIDPQNRIAPEIHDWTAPIDVNVCRNTFPIADTPTNFYAANSTPDDPLPSFCPTSDNEGWNTQQFGGDIRPTTNLTVGPGDLTLAPDGSSASVRVHASAQTGRVEVRFFVCRGAVTCLPQTSTQFGGSTTIAQIGAGGSATKTVPLSLGPGTWTVSTQVISRDNWEAPGGGPYNRAGFLNDNQTSTQVTVP